MAVVAALSVAPAAARAAVSRSTISTWTSSQSGTPPDSPFLISYDNPPNETKLTVTGQTNGAVGDHVDVVCFYESSSQDKILAAGLSVHQDGSFTTPTGTSAPALKPIAGHACRLRAVPTGTEGPSTDSSNFAGPDVAVSQAGLPSASINGHAYDFYAIGSTFTGYAGWASAGSCGPYLAPFDSSYGMGNFALDCVGSLLGANEPPNLPPAPQPTRSEVQIDGKDAYDAASAQAVFGGTEDTSSNFPSLTAGIGSDPTTGLMTSQSNEGWVVCSGAVAYPPTSTDCPHFTSAGISLQRDIATSGGGQVVTMTDTWSSTDGRAHSLDLLYDDYIGLHTSNAEPGYEFPGQSGFSPYGAGTTLPAPPAEPSSILVRSDLGAADGDPSQAAGAITFGSAPTSFTFVSDNELEEHRILAVPAGGSASVTYIYSTAYTVAQVRAMALAAQDRFQAPAIAISSPADGSTASTSTVNVTGTASAGSGVSSVTVAGQTVPVGPGGTWSAQVPLGPGSNPITALATDGAGATVQAQVMVVYQPPASPPSSPGPPQPSPPPASGSVCKVPRIEGMKLPAAERALRRAHCRVGRIRHERSRKVHSGHVIGTSPASGRRMLAGSKVELFVSRGS